MSQESNQSLNNNNLTQFFFGTPSEDEVKQYFLRQKRIADLKVLEASPVFESSPELSESFEMELQQRKQRADEIKYKMREAQGFEDSPRTSKSEPFRQSNLNNTTLHVADNTQCGDDSFLAMEKLCENTLHINNISENLVDLTSMMENSFENNRKSVVKNRNVAEETHLFSVEAPSFMFNNTSLMSPNKNSPLQAIHANRPSTILEVSEVSASNKTGMSSYQTALTRSGASEDYKTANEESFLKCEGIQDEFVLKKPKLRSFYEDSLEANAKISEASAMTKDSLNTDSYEDETEQSSSGVDSSYDQREEINEEFDCPNMNDTLEQIEFMLAQNQKMKEQNTPGLASPSPMTPILSQTKSAKTYLQPKLLKTPCSATKNSPLIKFSPAVKSPMNKEPTFKRPLQQSATKIPQISIGSNKKFQHIESPISRYIKHTAGLPLTSTARVLPGIGNSPKQFNFRDSDSYANENESTNTSYKGASLPFLAKTKSSAVSHVFDQRSIKKTPGGAKIQSLLAHTSPTVTVHQGHFKSQRIFDKPVSSLLNDTALSEQSFADLSLISGDVSVQIVEGVKRTMK